MRRLLLLTLAIALIASGAYAAKLPPREAPGNATLNYDMGRYLFEGFETGVPPAGWTLSQFGPTTWGQGVSGFEGLHEAHIAYDSYNTSDETLSVNYTVEAGDHLFFYTMGSQYWATNANFTVWVDGNLEYDFLNDLNYPGSWTWFLVDVDLAAYVGQTVTVDFNYAGLDGADQHFDAVVFGTESWTPPPEPDVDFCGLVEDVEGTGIFLGDTCDGQNLVYDLGCNNYSEGGLEDYYGVYMPAGSSFTASVTNTADGALWVVGECVAPGGAFTCLGYADATFTGDTEVVSYTNSSGMDTVVYLVIDSWGTDSCGSYEMLFESTGGAVANEDMSFGQVKALYR